MYRFERFLAKRLLLSALRAEIDMCLLRRRCFVAIMLLCLLTCATYGGGVFVLWLYCCAIDIRILRRRDFVAIMILCLLTCASYGGGVFVLWLYCYAIDIRILRRRCFVSIMLLCLWTCATYGDSIFVLRLYCCAIDMCHLLLLSALRAEILQIVSNLTNRFFE